MTYQEWIDKNVPENCDGMCKEIVGKMVIQFHELVKVRGHYYCAILGEREHWWLVDPAGNIVDPTKAQFPTKGKGHYEPWEEGRKEPVGLCMNCGAYCYENQYFCCNSCENVVMADYIG
jgi:hypothetical protein